MKYQVEFEMLAGGTRTVTVAQGQEVAIQQVKDVLRAGAAIHAVMRDAEGVAIWSGRDA